MKFVTYISRINGIVAMGAEEFYVTNDHYYRPGFMAFIEAFPADFHWTNVLHYKDDKATVAIDELRFPNGVNVSPDRKYLYLYSGFDFNFRVYSILPGGSLELKQVSHESCILPPQGNQKFFLHFCFH